MGNLKKIVLKKLELKLRIENSEIWFILCVEICNGYKKNFVGDWSILKIRSDCYFWNLNI